MPRYHRTEINVRNNKTNWNAKIFGGEKRKEVKRNDMEAVFSDQMTPPFVRGLFMKTYKAILKLWLMVLHFWVRSPVRDRTFHGTCNASIERFLHSTSLPQWPSSLWFSKTSLFKDYMTGDTTPSERHQRRSERPRRHRFRVLPDVSKGASRRSHSRFGEGSFCFTSNLSPLPSNDSLID